jgi:hypothetical protein
LSYPLHADRVLVICYLKPESALLEYWFIIEAHAAKAKEKILAAGPDKTNQMEAKHVRN